MSGLTALSAIRDVGSVREGTRVLINGASGGVGTFAVQIAKALGAEVTGVSSTRNLELLRSLGAHHVIDYTKEDFTSGAERYDVILDNVMNHSPSATAHTGGVTSIEHGTYLDEEAADAAVPRPRMPAPTPRAPATAAFIAA